MRPDKEPSTPNRPVDPVPGDRTAADAVPSAGLSRPSVVRKRVTQFFGSLVVLYGLAIVPWPGGEQSYARAFARCADYLASDVWKGAGVFRSGGQVRVYALTDQEREKTPTHDLKLVCGRMRSGQPALTEKPRTSARHLGYMPTVVTVSLILSTPLAWRRRLGALLLGLLCVHGFILIRFGLLVARIFHGEDPHCLYYLEAPWNSILVVTYYLAASVPATAYVVPIFIWVAVTFRRRDWEAFVSAARGTKPSRRMG